jgi:hypothetical protein
LPVEPNRLREESRPNVAGVDRQPEEPTSNEPAHQEAHTSTFSDQDDDARAYWTRDGTPAERIIEARQRLLDLVSPQLEADESVMAVVTKIRLELGGGGILVSFISSLLTPQGGIYEGDDESLVLTNRRFLRVVPRWFRRPSVDPVCGVKEVRVSRLALADPTTGLLRFEGTLGLLVKGTNELVFHFPPTAYDEVRALTRALEPQGL